ncbi:MAG TPA: sigma-70 family RNA polymerase sigma factor [Myxococcota bacterium]|nr:sigma-70 family RNA polymerase sigma factor [Myxococcota bacterium]
MHAPDEDVRLMLAFCAGDAAAFDALFRRWAGPLLRYLERMLGEVGAAEELVQEAFLRVHRARASYKPDARFSSWLYRIGTNLALNELRRPGRRAPHTRVGDGDEDPLPAATQSASDAVVDARREIDALDGALRALPERQRAALWLVAIEGQSYAEVAASLDVSEQAVKALVHRARASLAGLRAADGGEED